VVSAKASRENKVKRLTILEEENDMLVRENSSIVLENGTLKRQNSTLLEQVSPRVALTGRPMMAKLVVLLRGCFLKSRFATFIPVECTAGLQALIDPRAPIGWTSLAFPNIGSTHSQHTRGCAVDVTWM
jgi:hypothetical protein